MKNDFIARASKTAIDRKVYRIIRDVLGKITIYALRAAAERSLLTFYGQYYAELRRSLGWQIPILTAFAILRGENTNGDKITVTERQTARAARVVMDIIPTAAPDIRGYSDRNVGVPMQMFAEDYINDHVRPALDRLAKLEAKDPDDLTGRNSLRGRAEFEVRGQEHTDRLNALKSSGVKLAICSTHADCSARCAKYQGRVYSLDGTEGTTDDGRKYVPLEMATENPKDRYTTKAGRVYQNGLFGFNCRHYLVPYKSGYRFPEPNAAEESKEYAITETQRRIETNVRKWRIKAIEYKGADPKNYKIARAKAIEWNKRYIKYSKDNGRAYYPSRTKVL